MNWENKVGKGSVEVRQANEREKNCTELVKHSSLLMYDPMSLIASHQTDRL